MASKKTIIILSGITVLFALLSLGSFISRQNTDQELKQNYDKISQTVQNLLDLCTKSDAISSSTQCKSAASEIIDGCNGLSNPPIVCKDPRIEQISKGTINQQTVTSENSILESQNTKSNSQSVESTVSPQENSMQTKFPEIESFLSLATKWEEIDDTARAAKITVPVTMTGFNAIHNLSIIGPEDNDVRNQFDYLMSELRFMNSKQLADWIGVMSDRAQDVHLTGNSLDFFNEQMLHAQNTLSQVKDRELPNSDSSFISSSPLGYVQTFETQKKFLLENRTIIQQHYPIRDKIVEFSNIMQNATNEYVLSEDNITHLEKAEQLIRTANDLEYEIDGKLIAETNKLKNN